MKEFKGTPGLWSVDHQGDVIAGGDDNCVVALVSDFHLQSDLQKADANLIAAAPELLEALLDLKFKLYGHGLASPKIESVIAKALGESND